MLCCAATRQVFDEELHQLEDLIRHLATAGVDALIVQVGQQRGLMPGTTAVDALLALLQ